ncbi:hypothetical protein D9758_015918 [Tetrapyrgos nigripes]|uniref:T-complex protein 1 subunit beta n=1 Tax=Tetrapyrgos nigripes TaxID=182062 RepID=A0A8H5CJ74_9AGAR|nr:hypothetical protein D9758_015918 [Tetrapyrgos nigripes]
MLMVCAVDTLARETTGKKSVAIESFAKALRTIPAILAGNAGLDVTELVAELRAEHFEGRGDKGLDLTFSPTADVLCVLAVFHLFIAQLYVLISDSIVVSSLSSIGAA